MLRDVFEEPSPPGGLGDALGDLFQARSAARDYFVGLVGSAGGSQSVGAQNTSASSELPVPGQPDPPPGG